jgi:hypothetical protein
MQLWRDLNDRQARLSQERFQATVDCWNPQDGLRDVQIDDQPLAGVNALRLELPAITRGDDVERYVRGGDLIASYADRPFPRMRSEVYWRAAAHQRHGALAAVELIASLQTDLLDSHPELAVQSNLIVSEAYQLSQFDGEQFTPVVPPTADAPADDAPRCYLFRLPGRQFSYAEMVHAAEGGQSSWEGWLHGADYRMELRHQLFARTLEKGVILRARILSVLLERSDDKRAAVAHWRAFLNEAPPLTT